MNNKITIAIDGFAACGKSTLAKALAKELTYAYVDSGAMYRAVTLYVLNKGIGVDEVEKIVGLLDDIKISFQNIDGKNCTFLNGENVENAIRSMYVSNHVSAVSTISAVRKAMVAAQQELGKEKGIVMDGRDIGTVVFKDAELKLFMTADMTVRAQRRLEELKSKGIFDTTLEQVAENLKTRDHIDSTREDSPLRQAKDALVIDNSNLSPEELLEKALSLALLEVETKQLEMSLLS